MVQGFRGLGFLGAVGLGFVFRRRGARPFQVVPAETGRTIVGSSDIRAPSECIEGGPLISGNT